MKSTFCSKINSCEVAIDVTSNLLCHIPVFLEQNLIWLSDKKSRNPKIDNETNLSIIS